MNKYMEDILKKVDATLVVAGKKKDILQLYLFPFIEEIETDLKFEGTLKDNHNLVKLYTLACRIDLIFGYCDVGQELSIMMNVTEEDKESIINGSLRLLH